MTRAEGNNNRAASSSSRVTRLSRLLFPVYVLARRCGGSERASLNSVSSFVFLSIVVAITTIGVMADSFLREPSRSDQGLIREHPLVFVSIVLLSALLSFAVEWWSLRVELGAQLRELERSCGTPSVRALCGLALVLAVFLVLPIAILLRYVVFK